MVGHVRRAATLAAVLAAWPAATAAAGAEHGGMPLPVRIVLFEEARKHAAAMGERHPREVEAVRTTLAGAARAQGEGASWPGPSGKLVVYLVAMRGRFVDTDISVPPRSRATAARGSVLTLTIPVSAGAPYGIGLPAHYPHLRRAGVPVRLGVS